MQFVIIPCIFIMYMTSANNVAEHSNSLGRLGLIIFTTLLFVLAIRLFQPGKGILNDYFIKNTTLWWARLRYFWLIVFISIPVIIFGFAIMGYYISALEIQQQTIMTIRMIFIAIIVHNITIRWLGLTKRELALKNARNKSKAEELNDQSSESPNAGTAFIADEKLLDIPTINEQTEKIVGSGLNLLLCMNISSKFDFIN